MITEALANIFGWKPGHLLTEGFQVKCAGIDSNDGGPVETVRHLICTLDDHLPGAQAHAVGNPEFTDDLWTLDSSQAGFDWSNPVCKICSQPITP